MRSVPWLMALLLAGCFTPPAGTGEAQRALADAEEVGAAEYLPKEHAAVKAKLAAAQREIAKQNSESALTQSYRKANRLLAEAKREAIVLEAKTVTTKAEVKRAVERELELLTTSLATLESLEPGLVDPEGGFAFDVAVDRAQTAYAQGRYLEALGIVVRARAQADALRSEVRPEIDGV